MTAQAFRSVAAAPTPDAAGFPAILPAAIRLSDVDAADGWLARQVARAAGAFEHGLLGRAPTSVTVVGSAAWMVVHLHERFSDLERQVAASGEPGARRVREFHHGLFDRTAEALCEHVRLATGVALAAALAHVDTGTGSVLKTLATTRDIDLFLLGAGVPALGVPVDDHRRASRPAVIPASSRATNQGPGRTKNLDPVGRPASEPSAAEFSPEGTVTMRKVNHVGADEEEPRERRDRPAR